MDSNHLIISFGVIFVVVMIVWLVIEIKMYIKVKNMYNGIEDTQLEVFHYIQNLYVNIYDKIDMINNRVTSIYNDVGNVLLPSAYSLDKHLMETKELVTTVESDTKVLRAVSNAQSSKLLRMHEALNKNEAAMKHVLEFVRIMSAYKLRDELQRLKMNDEQPPEDLNADPVNTESEMEREKNFNDQVDF